MPQALETEFFSDTEPATARAAKSDSGRAPPAAPDVERMRIQTECLKAYIDAYKHHFDLFAKSWFLYFAIVGAVGSYLAKDDTSPHLQLAAAVLIATLSLGGIQRCQPLARWLDETEASLVQLSDRVGVPAFSLRGARSAIRTVQVSCLFFAAAAVLFASLLV
jgi:hypothetical protein